METQEKTAFQLAQKIAQALGNGWQACVYDSNNYSNRACLVQPEKEARIFLFLWLDGNEGKLNASGSFPRDLYGQSTNPNNSYREREVFKNDINISLKKSPERIAKDLQRRLFGSYLVELEKAWEKICEMEKDRAKAQVFLDKIFPKMDSNGRKPKFGNNNRVHMWQYYPGPKGPRSVHFDIEICDYDAGQEVDIEIRDLPAEKLWQILEILEKE